MAISKQLGKDILNTVMRGSAFPSIPTWYLGLCSSPPVNGVIPNGAEPSGDIGYQRTAIIAGPDNFDAAVDGTAANSVAYITNKKSITMAEITSGNEDRMGYYFLSRVGGNSNTSTEAKNVDMWGAFDRARPLVINSNLVIEANGAVFEIVNVD